jgi:hypothetical protein
MDERPTSSESKTSSPVPVIPLGYQPKHGRRRDPTEGLGLAIFRRIVLAVGIAFFSAGLVGSIWPKGDRDDRMYVGWGACLVMLAIPLGRSWRRWQADDPPDDGARMG